MMPEPITNPEPRDVALLIVDVQHGFINDSTRHIIPLVENLQNRYAHIFATRFTNTTGSPYRNLMDWHRFGAGSQDTELAFRPLPEARIIRKSTYTCVTPDFLDTLRQQRVTKVHICGIDTDVCVMKCAMDLFENGIRPVVLSKASASHAGDEYHQNALLLLRRQIGSGQIR